MLIRKENKYKIYFSQTQHNTKKNNFLRNNNKYILCLDEMDLKTTNKSLLK